MEDEKKAPGWQQSSPSLISATERHKCKHRKAAYLADLRLRYNTPIAPKPTSNNWQVLEESGTAAARAELAKPRIKTVITTAELIFAIFIGSDLI
jgi:hypothetical protein